MYNLFYLHITILVISLTLRKLYFPQFYDSETWGEIFQKKYLNVSFFYHNLKLSTNY